MAKKLSFFEKLTGAADEEGETKPVTEGESEDGYHRSEKNIKNISHLMNEETLPEETEGQLTIDVYQTDNDIIIRSPIAGVTPEDLDISITKDTVTVKGKRQEQEEIKEDDYYYRECYWGAFTRTVILPMDVDADNAEAGMRNGILTIRLPKAEKIKIKKIKVKSA